MPGQLILSQNSCVSRARLMYAQKRTRTPPDRGDQGSLQCPVIPSPLSRKNPRVKGETGQQKLSTRTLSLTRTSATQPQERCLLGPQRARLLRPQHLSAHRSWLHPIVPHPRLPSLLSLHHLLDCLAAAAFMWTSDTSTSDTSTLVPL
jgi:hypothetical protein